MMIEDQKRIQSNRPIIVRYSSHFRNEKSLKELDTIFFDSSATKNFGNEQERLAFRERWLGRYLDQNPNEAFLAISDKEGEGEKIVGYLVGSLDDPALDMRYSDFGYFQLLAPLTKIYPAQLHINIAPAWRGFGLGQDLIRAFVKDLQKSKVSGVHVITSEGMRNIRFYTSCGFKEVGDCLWNGRKLLMLGLRIA